MTTPDRPEIPTSADDMLERTRQRARQLRFRRRGAVAAIAAAALAAGIAVPLAVADHTGRGQSVDVVGVPSTVRVRPGPTGPPVRSTSATTPSTAPPSTPSTSVTPTSITTAPTSTTTAPSIDVTPTTTSSTPAVMPCTTRGLRAHLVDLGAAAGSAGFDLVLVNTGSVTCTIGGYPGVSYVTADNGSIVGAPAQRNPLSTPETIALAPGRAADAMLMEVDSLNYPSGTCRLTRAAGLRVFPPNQTVALFVAQPVRACANPADPVLSIGPLVAS